MVHYKYDLLYLNEMNQKYLVVLIIVLLTTLILGGIYLWQEKGKNEITQNKLEQIENEEIKQVNESQSTSTPSVTANSALSNSLPKGAVCDNFQCLITAAAECRLISASISYSGMPFLLGSSSGTVKFEIKKSSGVRDCILIFSSPVNSSINISNEGRRLLLDQGMTDAAITAYIQSVNDGFKSATETETTCRGSAAAVSDYLTDYESNLKSGTISFDVSNLDFENNTATHTTSSGKKLTCTTTE